MRRRTWSESDLEANGAIHPAGGEGGEGASGGPVHDFGGEGGEGGFGSPNSAPAWLGGEGDEGPMSPPIHSGGEGGGEGLVSDVRLKDDIVSIGATVRGLTLYRFRYKGAEEVYSGVIAQDVLDVMPAAVSVGPDGFYRVNYGMLGIRMKQLN